MNYYENTRGCIFFNFMGVPTVIRPSSWLLLIILGSGCGQGMAELAGVLFFVASGMICLLVHEYGHAFTCRALGGGPSSVEIASIGGVTYSAYPPPTRTKHLLMVLAGPGASLAAGLLVGLFLGILAGSPLGGVLFSVADPIPGMLELLCEYLGKNNPQLLRDLLEVYHYLYDPSELFLAGQFYSIFCYVCLWWSLLNLLPIFPLDGGKAFYLITDRSHLTYMVGMTISAILIWYCLTRGMTFNSFICAYLFYVNYRQYRSL